MLYADLFFVATERVIGTVPLHALENTHPSLGGSPAKNSLFLCRAFSSFHVDDQWLCDMLVWKGDPRLRSSRVPILITGL